MARVKKLLRKIEGNALWWFLEKAVGPIVLTAVIWLYQSSFSRPDLVIAVLVLVGGVALMIAAPWLRRVAQDNTSENVLARAPHLLVKYRKNDGEGRETLTLSNDGPETALHVHVGPLKWEQEARSIQLYRDVVALQANHEETVQIAFSSGPRSSTSLDDFMRSSTPNNAQTTVLVTFEDVRKRRFRQRFLLTTHIDGTLSWNPEPVQFAQDQISHPSTHS